MTQQIINTGVADKGNGDPLRTAFTKVNDNFTELFNQVATGVVVNATPPETPEEGDLWWDPEGGRLYISYDSNWIDASPVDGVGISSTDRLTASGKEVVLIGGSNPFVTFPAVATGENIIIQGAEIASANGTVAITSSGSVVVNTNALTALNTWTFGDDGNLDLPSGFINSNQVTGLNLRSGYDVHIISNHMDVDHEWILDSYGDLTIPGGIKSEGAINIDINLSDSTLRRWTFGEDGGLTFPAGNQIYEDQDRLTIDGTAGDGYVEINGTATILIGYNSTANVALGNPNGGNEVVITSEKFRLINTNVPTSSIGSAGDEPNMIASDNDYIYRCTGTYDGITNIWKRVAFDATPW